MTPSFPYPKSMQRIKALLGSSIIILLLFVGSDSVAASSKGKVATATAIVGNVFHKSVNFKNERRLEEGASVFQGDLVITQSGARAKLKFIEGGAKSNVVIIGSNSRLKIKRASRGNGNPGTVLILNKGSVRSRVNRKYSGEGKDVYRVLTPAMVAGVRGTIFQVDYDPGTRSGVVSTIKGRVAVAPKGSSDFVSVRKGMYVSAIRGEGRSKAVLSRVSSIGSNFQLKSRLKNFKQNIPKVKGDVSALKKPNPYGFSSTIMSNPARDGSLDERSRAKAKLVENTSEMIEVPEREKMASSGGKMPPVLKDKKPASMPTLPTAVPSARKPEKKANTPPVNSSIKKSSLRGGMFK